MSKKRVNAVPEGEGAAKNNKTPESHFDVCCVCSKSGVMMRCGRCKGTKYCSKECQKIHLPHHKVYCSVIADLEEFELKKLYQGQDVRSEQVDGRTRSKILKLIGEKPILRCTLDGRDTEVLWDTGSMVSMVDSGGVKQNFPEKQLHSIGDFLELENEVLRLQAANSTEISLEGVLLFDFSLQNDSKVVHVPFLVSGQQVNQPILGFNVIEH